MNIGFEGRTVLVTGAGHGFGRAIALAFADRGAHVVACDIHKDSLEETRSLGKGHCETLVCDVADRAAVHDLVARIAEGGQPVDILVNNAGGVRGQTGRPLEEISATDWQVIFDVNLSGAFFMSQAVAPGMTLASR